MIMPRGGCDGPLDVSDDMNKDHYSCPGGRGKGFSSNDDAMSWIRQNCDYRFVFTPSPTLHNFQVALGMGFWNEPRCRCQWIAKYGALQEHREAKYVGGAP